MDQRQRGHSLTAAHLHCKILPHMLLPLHPQFCEGVAPGEANVKDCLELHMWVLGMHETFAAPDCSSPIRLQHPTMLARAAGAATPAHVWCCSCCAALRCIHLRFHGIKFLAGTRTASLTTAATGCLS